MLSDWRVIPISVMVTTIVAVSSYLFPAERINQGQSHHIYALASN